MRVRHLRLLIMLQLLLDHTKCPSAGSITYQLITGGMCTNQENILPIISATICGAACSTNGVCKGFMWLNGQCILYSSLSLFADPSSTVKCYVAVNMIGTSQPTSSPATSSALSTSTAASVGGATTAGNYGPVNFADLYELELDISRKCNSNGGVAGIFQASIFYLLCRRSPNEIPLNTADPGAPCSSTALACLNTECAAGMIFIGFDQNGPKGPCYTISSSNQATVDRADCYVETSAATLPSGKGAGWTQWRVCRTDQFFVVTKAEVVGSQIVSVTCCRAKSVM